MSLSLPPTFDQALHLMQHLPIQRFILTEAEAHELEAITHQRRYLWGTPVKVRADLTRNP